MFMVPDPKDQLTLDDYASYASLAAAVSSLRAEAEALVPRLGGRKVWMVNSTAQGGGVAEMMPKMISILRELGVPTDWAVMTTDDTAFFDLTKQIHNLIHGAGTPSLGPAERALYESVNRANADAMAGMISPEDLLCIHDPQPMGMGAMLAERTGVRTVWRCHIGLDERTPQTRAAWRFLEPYAGAYDRAIFTAPEYIPSYFTGRTTLITPALDPLSAKNRELAPRKLVGVLSNGGLTRSLHPVLTPAFASAARRMQPDGTFGDDIGADEIGFLYRPIITEVSRWDRLKGFGPLMDAFALLKRSLLRPNGRDPYNRQRLELARLVLAGPDPASIQDDPEGLEVIADLGKRYAALDPTLQRDIAVISMPMASREENALMINAVQRCSTVVAQNSLREGFGLTATEAMWKGIPVLASNAVGLRLQVRDGLEGRRVHCAEDPAEIARVLEEMLNSPEERDVWGRNAQRRAYDEYLVFSQVARWLRTLADLVQVEKCRCA